MSCKSFEVVIPWEPEKRLGYAINRAMAKIDDWVLILDHDVFIALNPHWYNICLNAINTVGNDAGWITCFTNAIGCPTQKLKAIPSGSPMEEHFAFAEETYRLNKGMIANITETSRKWKLSGLFILTNRRAYDEVKEKCGFPDNKFIGWDNYYNDRLLELGYKLYLMQDLYVYHGYKRLHKNKEWGV